MQKEVWKSRVGCGLLTMLISQACKSFNILQFLPMLFMTSLERTNATYQKLMMEDINGFTSCSLLAYDSFVVNFIGCLTDQWLVSKVYLEQEGLLNICLAKIWTSKPLT